MTAPKTKTTEKTAAKDTDQVTVTVREGWAVCDGTDQHGGGAVVTVDRATAER